MKIKSKHSYFLKITFLVLFSLTGACLCIKGFYFSTVILLLVVVAFAASLYQDRKKLIERIERMIGGIRYADYSTQFRVNHSNDELDKLMGEMNEALMLFRNRAHNSMLEEAETKAWQKLISVLTHEIMNSIAPIISLSETLTERKIDAENDTEEYRIMKQAMETIHRRSKGLLTFVENYRTLTRLPPPSLQPIAIGPMLSSLQQLTSTFGISFSYKVYPDHLMLKADKVMMEQLLLNLLKNAKEACEGVESPKIEIRAEHIGDRIQITVLDNGQGIAPEALDKIFIPFYSTKAKGSGIGLSLCRQIMMRHSGKLSVK